MKKPSKTKGQQPSIRVVSDVVFSIGKSVFQARVVEDRGQFGTRHIFRVKTDDSEFELPAEDLRLAVGA